MQEMGKTLICMAYHQTPSTYLNILYFLRHGVQDREDHDYIIVVNGDSTVHFPSHVRVIRRSNVGFDFGAHAVAIESVADRLDEYDYFIFMNASVIGPILPPDADKDWVSIFRQYFFENDIGLLGTTIVCLPPTDAGGHGPRVEGFWWSTDRAGLDAIRGEGTILVQHPDKYSAIVNGEYGLSRCILRHGKNLGCMLKRYHGIDWRNRNEWHHNGCRHPSRRGSFYGTSIDPYEVIFHKWHWHNLPTVNLDIIQHHIREKNRPALKGFDSTTYRHENPDLQHMDDNALIEHFLMYGYNEQRTYHK